MVDVISQLRDILDNYKANETLGKEKYLEPSPHEFDKIHDRVLLQNIAGAPAWANHMLNFPGGLNNVPGWMISAIKQIEKNTNKVKKKMKEGLGRRRRGGALDKQVDSDEQQRLPGPPQPSILGKEYNKILGQNLPHNPRDAWAGNNLFTPQGLFNRDLSGPIKKFIQDFEKIYKAWKRVNKTHKKWSKEAKNKQPKEEGLGIRRKRRGCGKQRRRKNKHCKCK